MSPLPLDGILVVDLSQFLSGPMAATRLADLGARVIKVERPGGGDIGRQLAFADLSIDGDTLSFHIANRGKQSVTADLKNPLDHANVLRLIDRADVVIQNYRPGVAERLGLGYGDLSSRNPRLVYGSISGYGSTGPWRSRPGQDLLAQSISGLPWLNGTREEPPTPVGIALADIITSIHLAHGITAALLRREATGAGGLVETSLLESMLDLQFELISAKLNEPRTPVERGGPNSAHAFLPAPYGIYPTSDGYLALAMTSIPELGRLLELRALESYVDPRSWWSSQQEIAASLATHLRTASTAHWLAVLDDGDIWCAPVLTHDELMSSEGFAALRFEQQVVRGEGDDSVPVMTTRAPLRIDGEALSNATGAPRLGQHNALIAEEFDWMRNEERP